jgi:hypothetical protein
MSQEEAIMAMTKPVVDAAPRVIEIVKETIDRTKDNGSVVLIGVGNTSGVGNNGTDAKKSEDEIRKLIEKKENEKKKKKKFPFGKLPKKNF